MFSKFCSSLAISWVWSACVAAGLVVTNCGAKKQAQEPVFEPPPAKDTALEKQLREKRGGKDSKSVGFVAKPEWDMLSPHFDKFASALSEQIHSKSVMWKYKDAFASREEKFYPTVVTQKKSGIDLMTGLANKGAELKKEEDRTIQSILDGIIAPKATEEEESVVETSPPNPLVAQALDRYFFRIIMTGVANPEALVEDSDGNTYVVHVNDKIGSEGGYIAEILKHKVLIRIPDRPAPVEVSLAPASLPEAFAAQ